MKLELGGNSRKTQYDDKNWGSGIPELENRVKKQSYELRRHKTELHQIVTS